VNDINTYQKWTRSTIKYPQSNEGEYLTSAMAGEVGELFGAIAKYWREDYEYDELLKKLELELGDVMWMVVRLADYYDFDMSTILQTNINKLEGRLADGTIKGKDDESTGKRVLH